jgi:hypothetical protein
VAAADFVAAAARPDPCALRAAALLQAVAASYDPAMNRMERFDWQEECCRIEASGTSYVLSSRQADGKFTLSSRCSNKVRTPKRAQNGRTPPPERHAPRGGPRFPGTRIFRVFIHAMIDDVVQVRSSRGDYSLTLVASSLAGGHGRARRLCVRRRGRRSKALHCGCACLW